MYVAFGDLHFTNASMKSVKFKYLGVIIRCNLSCVFRSPVLHHPAWRGA